MTHEEILSMLGDYVDYLIANSSAEAPMWNIEKVRSGKPNKWNYIDGCMITACLSLYKTTGDEKYLKFSKDFIDWFVQEDGSMSCKLLLYEGKRRYVYLSESIVRIRIG